MWCVGVRKVIFLDFKEFFFIPTNSHHKKREVKWIFVLKRILVVSEITHDRNDCVHRHYQT